MIIVLGHLKKYDLTEGESQEMRNNSEKVVEQTNKKGTKLPFCFFPFRASPLLF